MKTAILILMLAATVGLGQTQRDFLYSGGTGNGAGLTNVDAIATNNIRFWGAIGDGVTDNTTAIQNAINGCTNVLVPTGQFIVAGKLILPIGSAVSGLGRESQIYLTDSGAITSTNTHDLSFKDLAIYGAPNVSDGIVIDNCQVVGLDGVYLNGNGGFTNAAIHIVSTSPGNSHTIRLIKNHIQESQGHAVLLTGYSGGNAAGVNLVGNRFQNNAGSGLRTVAAAGYAVVSLLGNVIEGNTGGAIYADALTGTIEGNHFEDGAGMTNSLVRCNAAGAWQGVVIKGNVFGASGLGDSYGVDLANSCNNIEISANTFTSCTNAGIHLNSAQSVTVADNLKGVSTPTILKTTGAGATGVLYKQGNQQTLANGTTASPTNIVSANAGYLGVGTVSPTSPIEVETPIANSAVAVASRFVNQGSGAGTGAQIEAGYGPFSVQTAHLVGFYDADSSGIAGGLEAGNNRVITFTANKWVGIATTTPRASLDVAGNVAISTTMTATNGTVLQMKTSFSTNYVIGSATNQQVFMVNVTNGLVTLPDATKSAGIVFRILSTNGFGSYTVTNATGTQTMRDGVSLSEKIVGIKPADFISDGASWFLVSKLRTVMPNAQFSTSTNIAFTSAATAYPISYDTTIRNNSQGIALTALTNGLNGRIYITNSGQYSIMFSAVQVSGHSTDKINIWLMQHGTNAPSSSTESVIGSANGQIPVTVEYIVDVGANPEYFELYGDASGTGCSLLANAASGYKPAMPSMIVTVKKISDPYP